METLKLTGDSKSMYGWEQTFQNLGVYLVPGDVVDELLVAYAYNVVPPRVMTSTMVQMGEPYDHNGEGGRVRYHTFQKHSDGVTHNRWVYTGLRVTMETVSFEGQIPLSWCK